MLLLEPALPLLCNTARAEGGRFEFLVGNPLAQKEVFS